MMGWDGHKQNLPRIVLSLIRTLSLNDAAISLLPGRLSCHCRDTETTILVNVVSS